MKTRTAIILLSLTAAFAGTATSFAQGAQNRGTEVRGKFGVSVSERLQVGRCGFECDGTGPGQGEPRRDGSGRVEKERPGNPQGNGTPRRDGSGGGQGNGRGKGNNGVCPNG